MAKAKRFYNSKDKPPQWDAKGNALCRWCSKPVPKRSRTWCSKACIHEYRIRADGGYLRSCVLFRDKGKCKRCGFDCGALLSELRGLGEEYRKPATTHERRFEIRQRMRAVRDLGFPVHVNDEGQGGIPGVASSLWQADHINPVAEGGGLCGLDNIQTLCLPCHKAKTALMGKS